MVRVIKIRKMVHCPEFTQYVSITRCMSCEHSKGIDSNYTEVKCGFEDKSSMRVMLDEDSRSI